MLDFIQNADWTILNWIVQTFNNDFFNSFMPVFTAICNHGEIWITVGLVLLLSKKYRLYGIILLVGLLIGFLVCNIGLKNLVMRPRPSWLNTDYLLLIDNPTDYSFPSGHTTSSFVAAVILTLSNGKFGYWAIPLAVMLAFSRLYLYVHFPSDILGGALIGSLIGLITFFVMRKFFRKYCNHRLLEKEKGL